MPRQPVDPQQALPDSTSPRGFKNVRPGGVLHLGVDLTGSPGQAVLAPESGVVTDVLGSADPERADNTKLPGTSTSAKRGFPRIAAPWDGYGPGIVVVRGDDGKFHLMAHLATQTVAEGDRVAEGQRIGTMATHVGASGSHVHWEVRGHAVDTFQGRAADVVDPGRWVAGSSGASTSSSWLWLFLLWAISRR